MKKLIWGLAAASAMSLGATSAMASEKGGYLAGNLGLFQHRDIETSHYDASYGDVLDVELSFESGLFLSGAVGYAFGNGFRGEFEIGHTSFDGDEVKATDSLGNSGSGDAGSLEASATIVTVAGYYDFQTEGSVSPYVGLGLGFANFAVEVDGFEDDETDLAGFGEAGLSIALNEKFTLAPSYRLLWIDNGGFTVDDSVAHIFKVGARFAF